MSNILSEKTLVPLSLVFILVGGTAWLATLNAKANANETALVELRTKQEIYNADVQEVKQSLARIEGAMGIKADK